MTNPRPHGFGSGLHYASGWMRANKSTGKIAIPEGPASDRPEPPVIETAGEFGSRRRNPIRAAIIADHKDALKPKRWRPT